MQIELANGPRESISELLAGEDIATFDSSEPLANSLTSSITQTHTSQNRDVLSLHGTKVTPGHSFLTLDGNFAKIGDILLNDGFIVDEHGDVFRARTREKVEEKTWKLYHAFGVRMAPPDGGWAAWSAEQGHTADGVARAYAYAAGLPLPSDTRELAYAGGADAGAATLDRPSAVRLIDNEFPFVAADGYVLPGTARKNLVRCFCFVLFRDTLSDHSTNTKPHPGRWGRLPCKYDSPFSGRSPPEGAMRTATRFGPFGCMGLFYDFCAGAGIRGGFRGRFPTNRLRNHRFGTINPPLNPHAGLRTAAS